MYSLILITSKFASLPNKKKHSKLPVNIGLAHILLNEPMGKTIQRGNAAGLMGTLQHGQNLADFPKNLILWGSDRRRIKERASQKSP